MKSAVETINPTRVKLSIEAPYAELKPSIDQAYKTISGQVQVPGFRRGKVPARVIDQRVGRPAVMQEAVNNSLDGFYREAVSEHELKPLGTPEVEVEEIPGLDGSEDGSLTFTVEVDVRPSFELPSFADITVEVEAAEVTDEDVQKELDQLRSRFGTLTEVDRPAKKDDFVTIDLTASIDGEEVDSAQGLSFQVGSGNSLEGLDEALEGLSAGEETTFETTLAGGEHAGEQAQVTVKVEAVKERELPEADDDFAELASEFDTIEELKADLREQASRQKLFSQFAEARDKLVDSLLEVVEISVPERLVEEEVQRHLDNEGRSDDQEHREEITGSTEKQIRTQFLLDAVVEEREITVEQPELIEYLISAAQQYGMNPNEFAQALDSQGQVPALVGEVGRNKALAAVLAEAKVVDTAGQAVDLSEFLKGNEDEAVEDSAGAAAAADDEVLAEDEADAAVQAASDEAGDEVSGETEETADDKA